MKKVRNKPKSICYSVDCLEEALCRRRKLEIFKSNHDSQFSCNVLTAVLKRGGQAFDNIFVEQLWRNVKHGNVYLSMDELITGLAECFIFFY